MRKFIKKIIHKIYVIGSNEHVKIQDELRTRQIHKQAIVGANVVFGETSRIFNHHGNREGIKIGDSSIIMGDLLTFQHGGEIIIGDYCFFGEQSRIWSSNRVTIGNRVLISHNVNIHDNNSHSSDAETRHLEFKYSHAHHSPRPDHNLAAAPIVIEDDVWIGFNSTILKGVTIGKGAIIGACSVVTKDVPPYTVMVGNPPKAVKFAD